VQILRWFVDRVRIPLLFVAVFVGFATSAVDARAQPPDPLVVTNTGDTSRGDCVSNCSLREAIKVANDPDPDRDTITFAPDLAGGTITLNSDLDPITDGVKINGSTELNLTVDGSGTDQIFSISTGTTTVKDLALEGAPLEIGDGASLSFDVSVSESDPSYEQQFDDVIRDVPSDDPPINGGGLIKEGDGTLTLRGANTYTGGTSVRAGTLRGDTTSLQGDITNNATLVFDHNNATLVFDQADNDDYTGVISGTGAVQKTGAGVVEFSSSNTYTGVTTISAGSLRLNEVSLKGDIAVESGGAVIFKHLADNKYEGNLTGAGDFIKRGVGTLTLSGTNTISGQSSLDEGALLGDFASIPRNLTTAGGTSVTFDHITDGTYSGDLKGGGDFTKLGTGTLTLSGTNTITGLASLDAGALQGGFAGIPVNLSTAAGTSVIFNHGNNGTYEGIISGMADVTK